MPFYLAFIFEFFIFYFIFEITYWGTSTYLLEMTEFSLLSWIFLDIYIIEFASIFYIRSRPSMRYYPIFHTFIIVFLLTYIQLGSLGSKSVAIMTGISLDLSILTWFITFIEIRLAQSEAVTGFRPT